MTQLIRGWFEDDGGISHAVAYGRRDVSLCGKPNPSTRDDYYDAWETTPQPRCKRCEQLAWVVPEPEAPDPGRSTPLLHTAPSGRDPIIVVIGGDDPGTLPQQATDLAGHVLADGVEHVLIPFGH